MTVQQIQSEVARLPIEKRGELLDGIIKDLGAPNDEVSDREVAQRVAETENGEVADISLEELVARMKFAPK